MPDDEETRVRQRLSRLFEPAGLAPAPPTHRPDPPSGDGPARAGRLPSPFGSVLWPDDSARSGSAASSRPGTPVSFFPPDEPASGPAGPFPADRPALGPVPFLPPDAPAPSGSATTTGEGWAGAADPRAAGSAAAAGDGWAADAKGSGGLVSRLPGPGAFDPGRRGVRALAVVAAVVVLVAGVWAWRSRPHAEPVRPVAATAAPNEPEPSPAGSSGVAAQLVVAVAGKVRRPGLVRLPAGARVADAIEAAGGALPGVDVALLNPARKLTDGELVLVGVAAPPGQAAQPGQPAAGPAAGGAAAPGGPVNLNTATLAQLDALPGVGPVLAQRILDHREQHGGFRSVSDLRQVEGIGDARYEQLKDLVTV
ncbi:helix-hairpin-helix domain-containing protein [Micromonospora sp. NPDC048930]|uniref:helix-hairpin-helix domain-containing protein n=1 Tax=Micromonospora sp. NPDC048930 TaxID=3364261 RepID=UPI003723A9AC